MSSPFVLAAVDVLCKFANERGVNEDELSRFLEEVLFGVAKEASLARAW